MHEVAKGVEESCFGNVGTSWSCCKDLAEVAHPDVLDEIKCIIGQCVLACNTINNDPERASGQSDRR